MTHNSWQLAPETETSEKRPKTIESSLPAIDGDKNPLQDMTRDVEAISDNPEVHQ
jgi:hypothetical protein